jgi:Zn-finger nucleic acid-binding protein
MTSPSPDPAKSRRRREEKAVRTGPGLLVCPRCGISLRGTDHDLGIAWRCGPCGGQSLNFSQFRRMVPEHGANDIWLHAATRPDAPRHRTPCPECLAEMDAVLIPFQGRQIELDICQRCQRLWLDFQEGQTLSLLPDGDSAGTGTMSLAASRKARAEAQLKAILENTACGENGKAPGIIPVLIKAAMVAAVTSVPVITQKEPSAGLVLTVAITSFILAIAIQILRRRL